MTTANDDTSRPLADQHESADPVASNHIDDSMPPPASAASAASTNRTSPHQSASRSLTVSGSPSTANSPESSRDSSPSRIPHRQPGAGTGAGAGAGTGTTERPLPKSGLRSRKSSTDVSPNRGPSLAGSSGTVPSAAAIQRALSSANIPNLPPLSVQQDPSRVPRHQKPTPTSGTASGETTPHWPISPRLKSPPPSDSRSRSRRNSLRKQSTGTDSTPTTPSIVVQSSSPASSSRIPAKDEAVHSEDDQATPTMKTSSRGASGAAPKLETVQEASLPATPGFDGLDQPRMPAPGQQNKNSDEEQNDPTSKVTEDLSPKPTKQTDNIGEGGFKKNDDKSKSNEQRSTSQRPHHLPSKSSFSSLSAVKPRSEAPSKNMTVETETVPSIPQSVLGNNQERSASGRGEPSGSLRLKPSNETIRPKKDKQKKTQRKAPSIHSNTVSSKADIFEAKVASAVDEANSSDSDETFVYESNPPEPQPHRSRQHHHSRTPSMTSIASLADPRAAVRDAHKIAAKKSSMKFANNPYTNPNSEPDANDRSEGTMRSGSGRVSGGSHHHHHIGRLGQARGGLSHVSVPDSDSSFPQSSKTRVISSRGHSQPNSPKFHTFRMGNGNANGNKKHGEYSTYDVDTENAADDERTPLIGTIRTQRTRTTRRPGSASLRQLEHQRRRNGGWCRRFAGCLVLSILLLVLIFSAVGLIMATTKELLGVGIYEIRNVIATTDEIMLDLLVDAVNPNIIGVTIADMDVNIFAKSKHVGSDRWWREHPHGGRDNQEDWTHITDPTSGPSMTGIDEGTDPIEDPEVGEPRTMLLGRIFHFDSPLSFDGTFFKHQTVESMGELRLAKPGNKTEAGGAERWEEVLQYPFELILRGVFKYQLPLSTREHSVPITASYFYDPDEEKKKVKIVTPQLLVRKLDEEKVDISKPWGRFDARGRLLPER